MSKSTWYIWLWTDFMFENPPNAAINDAWDKVCFERKWQHFNAFKVWRESEGNVAKKYQLERKRNWWRAGFSFGFFVIAYAITATNKFPAGIL